MDKVVSKPETKSEEAVPEEVETPQPEPEPVTPRKDQRVHPCPQEDQPHPIYGYDKHEDS